MISYCGLVKVCCNSLPAVPLPPVRRLTLQDIYFDGKPRFDILKAHFIKEGRLEEEAAIKIIEDGAAVFRKERTLIEVDAPVTGLQHQPLANGLPFPLLIPWLTFIAPLPSPPHHPCFANSCLKACGLAKREDKSREALLPH